MLKFLNCETHSSRGKVLHIRSTHAPVIKKASKNPPILYFEGPCFPLNPIPSLQIYCSTLAYVLLLSFYRALSVYFKVQ